MKQTVEERFWDKVQPEPNTGCWLWAGGCNGWGYAYFWNNHGTMRAHRWAWDNFVGAIPRGMYVLHSCDVRCCVNPAHLFVGTHADNMDDRNTKGRHTHGERQWLAKLTDQAVRDIRSSPQSGVALASKYGVNKCTISDVRTGRQWAHV